MADLISRQAAIDALESKTYRHTYLDQIVGIIEDLPSAQPELDTSLYADGFADGYKQGKKDAQPEVGTQMSSADCISRQTAIDALSTPHGILYPIRTVEALPSAQTEIVRCKDCNHHKDEEPGMVYCPIIVGGWVREDCFCSYAVRRTDG